MRFTSKISLSFFTVLTIFIVGITYYLVTEKFISPAHATSSQRHFPAGARDISIPNVNGVRSDLLQNISSIVEKSIADGNYPGAVILIAHRGQIIYQGIFGNRRLAPDVAPMQLNTIFDLASLTKVVATTPAIMQLIEQGKLELDAPVANYWPAFAMNGKAGVTIRQLLTHTSGLQGDVSPPSNLPVGAQSEKNILDQIENLKLLNPPGKVYLYSDLNFIVLAHLVEIITGEKIDIYARDNIFNPLEMKNTLFLPSANLRDRIAPTEIVDNKLHWGEVDDPLAYAMGGVSGNAGLFSDAKDLGIYAQCLLNNGLISNGKYLLGPLTILKMTTPQTPPNMVNLRGLGWDIDSDFSNRGILLPINSYGHTGWTGTSIWIDPTTQTWIIILTSRTYPSPDPDHDKQLIQDRRAIANIVAASITDISLQGVNNTGKGELNRAYPN